MHAFDVLGDPVRRRILELLAEGERSSGEVVEAIGTEFGIGQPAVSMQLKVLRESGFATARAEGSAGGVLPMPVSISDASVRTRTSGCETACARSVSASTARSAPSVRTTSSSTT